MVRPDGITMEDCPRCGAPRIHWTGEVQVCSRCRDAERAPQGEAVRLFTPAPAQLPGQATFGDLPREPAVCGGTGGHDGQPVDACDECDSSLFAF